MLGSAPFGIGPLDSLRPRPAVPPPVSPVPEPLFSGAERTKGAPHSSQYCAPSMFSVLHFSQVIIRLTQRSSGNFEKASNQGHSKARSARDGGPSRERACIVTRNENSRQPQFLKSPKIR